MRAVLQGALSLTCLLISSLSFRPIHPSSRLMPPLHYLVRNSLSQAAAGYNLQSLYNVYSTHGSDPAKLQMLHVFTQVSMPDVCCAVVPFSAVWLCLPSSVVSHVAFSFFVQCAMEDLFAASLNSVKDLPSSKSRTIGGSDAPWEWHPLPFLSHIAAKADPEIQVCTCVPLLLYLYGCVKRVLGLFPACL